MAVQPHRPGLGLPVLATLAGLGLCLDQARLGYLARHAEVARLLCAPPLWLWSTLAVGMLVAGGVGLHAALRQGDARRARVPLLAAVVVGFVELFVTPAVRPVSARLDAVLPVRAFAETIRQSMDQGGGLPESKAELDALLAGGAMGRAFPGPALLLHGEPIEQWEVQLQQGCGGPALDAGGARAGSFLYCVEDGGGAAWLTAVGRCSSTFGGPELLSMDGRPVWERLVAPRAPLDAGGAAAP